MTGYTVHTGASKKFVSGWDRVFSEDSSTEKGASKKKQAASGAKKNKTKKTKK